ncbi:MULTISPECIES: GlxA family transcriptional regulator [Rhodococcus]|uniref:GlxA family transcriptional regulator n=1 Tax=Rhodococcus TaxID=1827 RepID=UPI000F53D83C|nr:helix-turn-helix domain-containing protein [Rhodococcus ruber]MDO1482121.1 helix-turn-helix domain-containing protein [Rhodococcus ruber]MDO2378454.1 helix-turn-helix domain-containing protein [Rhodococcus ruber]RQM32637.1 AraC family transcriptional regulator [Rhodococcus ruber]
MRIAVYTFDDITMFHLAAPLMVFGEVTRLDLAPGWQTRLWSDRPGSVRTAEGYPIGEVAGPETVEWADIVIVPSWPRPSTPIGAALKERLHQAHARGAIIAGLCLGAFAVADAGLLDGRAAVTHWEAMPLLAERCPGSEVDSSVLYIDHDDVLTSAGTASAIDACLYLVRKHLGSAAATRVARHLVVAPHREGGQAQYIERPLARVATDTVIAEVLEWALTRLDEPLPVDRLAEQANMSRRSFVRHFQQATGTTPARWILERRLQEARVLLETTDWSIDAVASSCGFASPVTFRQNFTAAFSTTPTAYRRQFASPPQATVRKKK